MFRVFTGFLNAQSFSKQSGWDIVKKKQDA